MSKILVFLLVLILIAMKMVGPHAILDARLYYTGDEARELFSSFDAHEKLAYFYNELLDFLFITTYSALFFVWTKKLLPSRFRWLAFVAGSFDLVETALILYATKTDGPWGFFDWLGYVTLIKWIAGTIVSAVLITRALKHRAKQQSISSSSD